MIRPTKERILIEPCPMDEHSGPIYIPIKSRPVSQVGWVRAVGPSRVPHDVKVGDRVVVDQYIGEHIEHDGRALKLVHRNDVMAIV